VTGEAWIGWVLVVGMAAIVFFTRALFVLPSSRLQLPPAAERMLRYAPAAALMAIIVPDLVLAHGTLALAVGNPRLVGGLVAFALAVATRSILLTIAGGMLAFSLIRILAP